MGLTLRVLPAGSSAEVRVEGEIDVCVADRLQDLLLLMAQAHGPLLLLDLSAVSFVDCAGLRALVLPLRQAEKRGWSVYLTPGRPTIDSSPRASVSSTPGWRTRNRPRPSRLTM